MKILYFCTTWGQKTGPWKAFLEQVAQAGYDGVETDLPAEQDREDFHAGLQQHGLHYIGQHWQTATPGFDLHAREYRQHLQALASLQPLLINSHTGRDYFSFAQNAELVRIGEETARNTGVPVTHETHRSRFAYAAHVTAGFLQAMPGLQLTLDISHWCSVAESLLHDQPEAVELAIRHTRHIHARIGFEQGPQVDDPADPAWTAARDFHLDCWDKVVALARKENRRVLTFTPEFGPWPYMPGRQPAGKQWEYNLYMLRLLKTRYAEHPNN